MTRQDVSQQPQQSKSLCKNTATTTSCSTSTSSSSSLRFSIQSIQEEKERYGQQLSNFLVASDVLHGAIDKARHRRMELTSGGGGSEQVVVDLSRTGAAAAANEPCNRNQNDHCGDEFLDLLEAELGRVTQTIASQLKDQELSAKALLSRMDDIMLMKSSSVLEKEEATLYLRAKVHELCDLCLKLQRFVDRNADLLRQVASRADAEIGTSCTSYLNRRLAVSPWKELGPNSALVVVLSDMYSDIRKLEAKNEKAKDDGDSSCSAEKWVAPSTFERRTTKYWVREDKLTELLLAAVAEAPLLVYGKSGRLTTKSDNQTRGGAESDTAWDSSLISTPISSVYFDSPTTMCMYKERIQRSEGAQLFRMRWYGQINKPPRGDEHVFLELKTHHEVWIVDQSVKERVAIREKDICRFLSSSKNCWTLDVAKELVLGASPALSGDKLNHQVELLQKMHHLVISKDLRPCVRTMYNRTAFQSTESNKLRLTLDRNVTLMDETQAPPGTWCLPHDAAITTDMISHVPYPVFEVKLYKSEKLPDVFQHLIDNGALMEAPKFSKFLTGAASFFASSRVDIVLPYWAEDEAFRELTFNGNAASSHREDNNEPSVKSYKSSEAQGQMINDTITMSSSSCTLLVGNMNSPDSKNKEGQINNTPSLASESSSNSVRRNNANGSKNNDAIHAHGSGFFLRRRPPTEQNATESSINNTSGKKGAAGGVLFGFATRHHHNETSPEPKCKVAPKKPARVEPKSYFANERTFIQWISAALLLVTASAILLDFQNVNGVPSTTGITLNACAVVIIVYSMISYYRRIKLLQRAAPYGYVDHFGPIILGLAVLLGVSTLLYYYVTYTMHVNSSSSSSFAVVGKTLMADTGKCFQHPITGISSLQYQPSGVAVDKDRDLLLVASLDRITALSTATPDLPIETLVVIPGADIEALTFVGDRLFALGEDPNSLTLFELGRVGSSSTLVVKQQWELETTDSSARLGAEGLVYIPDPHNVNGGALYVACDNFNPEAPQDRGVVYIYDLPLANPVVSVETTETTTTKIQRKGILNSNLLNMDLSDTTTGTQLDSKIGDLHYFDGVLYVLHDNAEVIRAWDAKSGDLLATMRLPRVAKKFSKRQWEGMALEYITGSDPTSGINPSLRGRTAAAAAAETPSPSSTLILHLALDTPPQVWSFSVTTSPSSRGSILFPSCAAAD